MTYLELEDYMQKKGFRIMPLFQMMDMVEEEKGSFPNWEDEAEDWIIDTIGASHR